MRLRFTIGLMAVGMLAIAGSRALDAQATPPVPRPFPGMGTTSTSTAPPQDAKPVTPAPSQQTPPASANSAGAASVDPGLAGAPLFPSADLLESYDAGRGQRYYLFGTNVSYLEVVAYYKKTLNNGGRELFKTPAMQQFDLGKFQDQTMAYPPSIVVKDYTWNGSTGYLHVVGAQEKRYATVIQIVPR